MNHRRIERAVVIGGCVITLVAATPAIAQQASRATTVEEIVVTGTYIGRSADDMPSPITVLGQDDLSRAGRDTIAEVFKVLPITTGSFTFGDPVAQRFSSAANLDLRGLGPTATLVLLNGRRQTVAAIPNQDGNIFADVNSLVPPIAIERVEIIKDGASALYGSDAVAGLANFITRDDFEGAEFQASYSATDTDKTSDDVTLSMLLGGHTDRAGFMFAASYLDRSELLVRQFPDQVPFLFASALANPGSYALLPGQPYVAPYDAIPPGTPIIDPLCGSDELGGFPDAGIPAGTPGGPGLCRMLPGVDTSILPDQQRTNVFASGQFALSDAIEIYGEFGYAREEVARGSSPSFGALQLLAIPASNPGNFLGGDVLWLGRPIGLRTQVTYQDNESDTSRGVVGLRGDFNEDWSWDASAVYADNSYRFQWFDSLRSRLVAALNCEGGPGNDQCFNPFGSEFLASPGSPLYNDPAVIDDFFIPAVLEADSSLKTYGAIVTGQLMELPAGPLGVAFGAQYRDESLSGNWSDEMNRGEFVFVPRSNDYAGDQDVWGAFAEVALPIADSLDVQLAARYEDYGGDVDTFDPKIAVLWRPVEHFTLRGSWGTSFAAPSAFQLSGTITSVESVFDPATNMQVTPAVFTQGNADLEPYDSTNWTLEAVWQPIDDLRLALNYWNFDIEDIIVAESPQAVFNNDPFDPRIVRNALGSPQQVNLQYINAAGIEADGFDLSGSYGVEIGNAGRLSFDTNWTYVLTYDLQESPTSPVIDGVGQRNFVNPAFGAPQPEYRGNLSVRWDLGGHSASITGRYTDGFENDQNPASPADSFTTVDIQYSFALDGWFGNRSMITLGAVNVFDEDPSYLLLDSLAYDATVHDGRRRMLYVRLFQAF
jgi:outer membrane receptor protein involved in Fe transport